MCGICGLYGPAGWLPSPELKHSVERMTERLRHRGPDRHGSWVSTDSQVAFGHARLAVVDLTPAGDQPMTSSDGRWTITYNGEIYNTRAVRSSIGRPSADYKGHSDTEVLVESIAAHGVQRTLEWVTGMFAFAVWDHARSELWLVRDRFGEKPLYYGTHGPALVFGSELRAITALPGFSPMIDRAAVAAFFKWTNIPAPQTIFEGVKKLQPGHLLHVASPGTMPEQKPYWSAVDEAVSAPALGSDADALEEFETLFEQVVADRMVSDVPLGAFLSGGLDSSAVVAMMQRSSMDAVRTFTVAIDGSSLNEAPYAAKVAQHLGTDHTELLLTPEDALAVVPDLPRMYDEPFADSSQIPTHLVSRMAREQVTVALSGDGGDEIFGGYDRYQWFKLLSHIRGMLPATMRQFLGKRFLDAQISTWDRLGNRTVGGLLPQALRHRTGHRMHKVGRLLLADSAVDVYEALMSLEIGSDSLVLGGQSDGVVPAGFAEVRNVMSLAASQQGMLVDTLTYLPNDLLTKVDRASMAVSLEVRAPFLDPALYRFAWGLPSRDRIRRGRGKWVIRQFLSQILPSDLVDRPKMGFGIPVGEWLRGPLRVWAEDLLDPSLLVAQGYLDADEVRRCWQDHLSRRAENTYRLWTILMFQAWLMEQASR